MTKVFTHATVAVIAALATWGAVQLNKHPGLQNFIDREAVVIRHFGFSCGVERWSIKTLADSGAAQINFSPRLTTIASLQAIPSTGEGPRTAPTETTTWAVNATILAFKQEADSDIHLELSEAGKTMISELPLQSCITPSSNPLVAAEQQRIGVARASFLKALQARGIQVTGSYQTINMPVAIAGVGFFDFLHGQRGVAPNGIELHPVIALSTSGPLPPTPTTPAPTTVPVPTTPPPTTPVPVPKPSGDDALDELPGCTTYPRRVYYWHVKQNHCAAGYFTTP